SLADKYNMLPEESFYYKKLSEKKIVIKNDFKENVLNIRKIYLYIAASIFFYMSSVWMPENKLVIYISYFFIALSIFNILYFYVIKYNMKKQNTKVKNK
ncbi:MAG: hypothetical protein WC276_04590, partial [Sedimentibacter sp.]